MGGRDAGTDGQDVLRRPPHLEARLALQVAAFGLAQQPLSAPIESPKHRAALAARFAAAGEEPLLLVRLGHGKPPEPTPRRGVALVSTWRNS